VARDIRLALPEKLRKLPNSELFLRRQGQKAQANRLREEAIKLPALGSADGRIEHTSYIFMNANERK
jgi:hypothetical protein